LKLKNKKFVKSIFNEGLKRHGACLGQKPGSVSHDKRSGGRLGLAAARASFLGNPVQSDQADEAIRRSALLPTFDIALLQGIRHLLYDEGYTIKGVQRILREQGIAHVVPEQSAASPAQQAPTPDPASQLTQPSQPMPAPLPPGMATPHPVQPVNPAPVAPAPAQAYPSQPQGATQAATALSVHQTEALVQALRTLMDCKAQLDNARPAPQAKPPIAQT
jgi:DNA-binding transcriptional MerR regulator